MVTTSAWPLAFAASYITQKQDYQLSHLVIWVVTGSFILVDITASCKLMTASEAIRQLSHCLAFNLHNLGPFGIEENPTVSLKFWWY